MPIEGNSQSHEPALSVEQSLRLLKGPGILSLPNLGKGGPLTQPENVTRWNTANLGWRLGADATAAASASILVAPLIAVIDRSIVVKASTGTPFSTCFLSALRPALTRPHTFLASRPFLLVFSLYFNTYLIANAIDTVTSTITSKPATTVTSTGAKFVATSAVNMSLCVYKDSYFAKAFGAASATSLTSSAATRIPKLSYALFSARDSLTIFASFNLPPLLAPHLEPLAQHFPRLLSTSTGRSNTAQFLTPALMQIFSTPIHLLGLDLYNRQNPNLGFAERFARVRRDWGVSALARMGRIVPAFGVGGVVNGNVRRACMEEWIGTE